MKFKYQLLLVSFSVISPMICMEDPKGISDHIEKKDINQTDETIVLEELEKLSEEERDVKFKKLLETSCETIELYLNPCEFRLSSLRIDKDRIKKVAEEAQKLIPLYITAGVDLDQEFNPKSEKFECINIDCFSSDTKITLLYMVVNLAICLSDLDLLKMLPAQKVDWDQALFKAVALGKRWNETGNYQLLAAYKKIIEFIISKGADINWTRRVVVGREIVEDSPFHRAIFHRNIIALTIFLSKNFIVSDKILRRAQEMLNVPMYKYLLDKIIEKYRQQNKISL